MWKLFKKIIYILLLVPILSIVWGRFFNPIMTIIQAENYFKYYKLDRKYIPINQMGDNILKAVITAEDQNYYKHSGFDFQAIERTVKHNQKGKSIQGGSTISQQTAKNIFLWNGRSWIRKGLEAIFTFTIEKVWNKNIILERYLNSIEMGQGVFGIEAAAHYYYNKDAKDLTKSEAAWIATILPNPKKYDPKHPTPFLIKKHNRILRQMNAITLQP
ncbi:monofunctional biosynthetic peptidoglycan transglycosylase [Riemerella columbipharyngis]|uniref:Biosynthetic peptidoglycan transglycosylase n=1 Tax=Riemerella columbipharyngis TaxID=1071918 RepID=A0A1G7BM93_9FLAO|nr:monofunctional biosynthetic peptidoglycan transglycosylase [Riemerella columbipharyngis]SDE28042.1 monofunctional biosynthetic peptidoglycan transglycosylase [Riemerella columbipharyngis]